MKTVIKKYKLTDNQQARDDKRYWQRQSLEHKIEILVLPGRPSGTRVSQSLRERNLGHPGGCMKMAWDGCIDF